MKQPTSPIKVLLSISCPFATVAVESILKNEADIVVYSRSNNPFEIKKSIQEMNPEVVILNLEMGNHSFFSELKKLASDFSDVHFIILAANESIRYPDFAIESGAKSYLEYKDAPKLMAESIRQVRHGKLFFSHNIALRLLDNSCKSRSGKTPIEKLTNRELQVLELIGVGKSPNEIGKEIGITNKTAANYKELLRHKLNLRNSYELTRYAIMLSLFDKSYMKSVDGENMRTSDLTSPKTS